MYLGAEGVCCGVEDELASSFIAFASAGLALFGGRLFVLLNFNCCNAGFLSLLHVMCTLVLLLPCRTALLCLLVGVLTG